MDISLKAAHTAQKDDLEGLAQRNIHLPDAIYYSVFPGEHYRLLHSLTKILQPQNIIEIGTFTGMGSASLLEGMPLDGKLITFDVVGWDQFETHINPEAFQSGRITQYLDDLSARDTFEKYRSVFGQAQMIFCDAPKDGNFEPRFLSRLSEVRFESDCLLILDDIRLLNMIDIWRSIKSPKIDLTSFGHWSGTGLVDITHGLILNN